MTHKVLLHRELCPTTFVLRVSRGDLSFATGQSVSLGIKGSGLTREYTIYSGERDDYLEFLVKEVKSGTVSPLLRKLKTGDELDVFGPFSDFRLERSRDLEKNPTFLFVATGTGIAPFHSFVRSSPDLRFTLLHGVRSWSECYDREVYKAASYIPCLSREAHPEAFSGRVTSYLASMKWDFPPICYLCGNHDMINEVYEVLRSKGITSNRIFSEVFF